MRITQFTDYSLRVLLYLGLKGQRASVAEITIAFKISRNHLVKVAHGLSTRGYIDSFKGKGGGIALARDPARIRIGEFVRELEPMELLECFNIHTNTCPIQGACLLERVLLDGRKAFVQHLDGFTLADFLQPGRSRDERLRRLGLARKVE